MGTKKETCSSFSALPTKVRTRDTTYTEHCPNISKRIQERRISDKGDEKTDAKDGKGRGRLDEQRSKIGVHPG